MPQAKNKPQTPKEETSAPEADPMVAAVISSLVAAGTPYAEAVKMVQGGGEPAKPVDVEPPVVPQKSNDFSDDQVQLYEKLQNIDEEESYEATVRMPSRIYDWVIRKTLEEAYIRNNPNFLVPDFLLLMLKEQRSIDPTKGGKVTGGATGPQHLYNPVTGKWN